MDKKTITECIDLAHLEYQKYYEEAKRVGQFDQAKEAEYVRAAIALSDLKSKLWEMYQRCKD